MMRRVGQSPDHARPTFVDTDRRTDAEASADVNSIAEKISSQQAGASASDLLALGGAGDRAGGAGDRAASSRPAHARTGHDRIVGRMVSGRPAPDDGEGASHEDGVSDGISVDTDGAAGSVGTVGAGNAGTGVRHFVAAPGREAGDEPSPADMPKRREHTVSALSFAALGSHELPVVREYSAGGLIFNESGEVAIIARHSRSGHLEWCLPKGHIEKGETPEQTAVREVHEETGIKGKVTGSIATIDYWFTGENQRVHKLVHHFVLRQVSGHLTVEGDPDHEAEDAAWVPFHELPAVLSYPNERRIVHLYSRKYRRRS